MQGVQGLTPYEPGKPIEELEREFGIHDSIKLASNENPLGPSSFAIEAIRGQLAQISFYPDGNGFDLKRALAYKHKVDPACLTLGNGSNDVLDLIGRAFLDPGREAVFSEHAFAVYPIVTQATGAKAQVAPANDRTHDMPFGHDLEAMLARVNHNTSVVFIANPNNPTGTWLNREALEGFIEAVPGKTLVVVDEAYFEYVQTPDYPDASQWLTKCPNLIVTRTFSKIHGLAGLRIGYSISHPDVADLLNRVRQPFNVNNLAQHAALAALEDSHHVSRSVQVNTAGLRQLEKGFKTHGLSYIPSVGNFICVDTGRSAMPVYQALLKQAVIVRPIGIYGLPRHLRVTVGTSEQNQRVLQVLEKVLNP